MHKNFCQQHEFIESFLFLAIFVTYNIDRYIFIYIFIKSVIVIPFLLSSAVIIFLHCMLNILRYEKKNCEIDEWIATQLDPSSDVIFWVLIVNPFSLLCSIFFFPENCVSFGLLVSYLSLSQSAWILLVNLLWGFSRKFLLPLE